MSHFGIPDYFSKRKMLMYSKIHATALLLGRCGRELGVLRGTCLRAEADVKYTRNWTMATQEGRKTSQ